MSAVQSLIDKLTNARPRNRLLAGLGLGALAALGQAPLGLWPLTVIGLTLTFGLFRQTPGMRGAALTGWAVGTGYFLLALHWIVEPFFVDAERHAWMAPFALLFMAAGLALFWALAFAVAHRLGRSALVWGAALTLAEAGRGALFTGFPWAQPGHVWIGTPMMQWASLGGALALCLLTTGLATCLWHGLAGHRRIGGAGLTAALALYLGGLWLNPVPDVAGDAPMVRLIQPNAAQHEKWDPAMIPVFFQRQMDYTAAAPRADLVVWPETAIPVLLNNAAPTLDAISEAAGGAPVVLGAQRRDGPKLYNSLVLVDPGGTVASIYDKHHLVPFGEYIPFGRHLKRLGLRGLASEDGNGYSAGPGAQIIGMGDLGRALPLICYEGVFPQDVASAPGRADFMLLVTNDAWFGQLSGPYQHLAQARLRSVEQGLPMIRVANTGVSAMIDARGQITGSLPLGQAGYLDTALPPPLPPTLYARTGDLPMLLILLLALGGASAKGPRRGPLSD